MKIFIACAIALAVCLPAAGGEEPVPAADPVLRVSIDWLVNDVPNSHARGLPDAYAGKTLLLNGWADEFGRDAGGWYVTIRRFSARPTGVRCYFPAGAVGSLDDMYRGKPLELLGDYDGYNGAADFVVLRNARLVVSDFSADDIDLR